MADPPVSLKFTPESKQLLRLWPVLKVNQMNRVIARWVQSMKAWFGRETTKAFQDQKQPGTLKLWPVNTDAWQDFKASHGYSRLTNIHKGAMKKSISLNKSKTSASVGSPLPYSVYTQDRKNPDMNRDFRPDKDYALIYATSLAVRLIREEIK